MNRDGEFRAQEFLIEFLKEGPRRCEDIHKEARLAGIKARTSLIRAKDSLNIKISRINNEWYWELPRN